MRETACLWFWLSFWTFYAGRKGLRGIRWRFPEFIRRKIWTSEYFWQDTFLVYLNKYIICKLFGHKKIIFNDCEGNNVCLNCNTRIKEKHLKQFSEVKIKSL